MLMCHYNYRLMFFTDENKLETAKMDGRDRRELFREHLYQLSSVALDIPAQRVYFCDPKSDRIDTVLYDGTDRRIVSFHDTTVGYCVLAINNIFVKRLRTAKRQCHMHLG